MPESLDVSIGGLDEVLGDLEAAVREHRNAIDAVASEHRRDAGNLVRSTAPRQRDLRDGTPEVVPC